MGITGLSPEAEPEPAKLAERRRLTSRRTTSAPIYAETLVSPAIADTVARETGARVATLDPIEGLTDSSAGARLLRGHALQPRDAARRPGLLVTDRAGGAPTAVLSLRSAAFGYGDRPAVSDVDLDVQPGEVVALLGPNGSGKSTLVRGLLGLNDHLAGQVSMFGTPIADFHEHARLGYVPQRHTLSASVRATVAGGRRHRPAAAPGLARAAERPRPGRRRARRSELVGLEPTGPARTSAPSPAASSGGCSSPAPSRPSPTC